MPPIGDNLGTARKAETYPSEVIMVLHSYSTFHPDNFQSMAADFLQTDYVGCCNVTQHKSKIWVGLKFSLSAVAWVWEIPLSFGGWERDGGKSASGTM